jgi:predicted MPP superfamily phosphohydrolase
MVVSKGLGVKGIPTRINCKPEITIIDFQGERNRRSYY